jgi:hypothetical protein
MIYREMKTAREIEILFRRLRLYDRLAPAFLCLTGAANSRLGLGGDTAESADSTL